MLWNALSTDSKYTNQYLNLGCIQKFPLSSFLTLLREIFPHFLSTWIQVCKVLSLVIWLLHFVIFDEQRLIILSNSQLKNVKYLFPRIMRWKIFRFPMHSACIKEWSSNNKNPLDNFRKTCHYMSYIKLSLFDCA